MAVDFGRRFEELSKRADEILAAKTETRARGFEATHVDQNELVKWQVNARHLLAMVSGRQSEHLLAFEEEQKPRFTGDTNYSILLRERAVLLAAKDDYEGGYLTGLRELIQSEVFESELEQAHELFYANYIVAAAVIAGTVLETTLRQLCSTHQIEPANLDKMNANLAKAGVYNSLVQKRITALAAVRNSAAHGKANEFTKDDVSAMIRDVERFVTSRAL